MTNPIYIDLRDLTPEKLAKCRPHMGLCEYSSPCVIGALAPKSERGRMDADGGSIGWLLRRGVLTMPKDQQHDAIQIQYSFDRRDWYAVERIAAKWMRKEQTA